MKTFRIVVGVFGVMVLVFFIAAISFPPMVNDQDALLEVLFTIVAIPIFIFNLWAWTDPELIEISFMGKSNGT